MSLSVGACSKGRVSMARRTFLAVALSCLFISPALHAEDHFFDSNGVKIRYIDEGKGEPVVLIHGFTANIEFQWTFPGIIKSLVKDYRVIAIDNRGHGRSGKPHEAEKYGLEMTADVVRLLDHLKVKKAHIVGYSMGALITCKLLTTNPDRFLSATLGGAGGVRGGDDHKFFDLLADSLEQGNGLGPLLEFLTPAGRMRPTEEQIKLNSRLLSALNDTKALAAVVRGWKGLTVTEESLKANRVPTLGLVGALDPLKIRVDELDDLLPEFKKIVIAKADHMNAFNKTEFIASLRAFLAEHHAQQHAGAME
jgi:pimeloyl-ACP methyl ester carboxylesterase